MKILHYSLLLIFVLFLSCNSDTESTTEDLNPNEPDENSEEFISSYKTTFQFKSTDSLTISADFYELPDSTAPFLLLFHQAGYSRGEYKGTAHYLNDLGFNCIAIDQRSGNEVNGVLNETNAAAKKMGLDTEYADAYADLEAALLYVKNTYNPKTILAVGSSYSASLVFILANKHPNLIDGIASFSPGEYFTYGNKTIESYASNVNCPVFITSSKDEFSSWEAIYNAIPGESKSYFLPDFEGYHGSQALWSMHEGNEKYRKAFKEFLDNFLEN
jgi:pimeloyl-ACP methyl ester carboxylesterase